MQKEFYIYTYVLGNAYGMCDTDVFNIAAPGSAGSPQICGTNTGYHSK